MTGGIKLKRMDVDCCINGLDMTISVVFNIPVDLKAIGGCPRVQLSAKGDTEMLQSSFEVCEHPLCFLDNVGHGEAG